MGAADLIVRPPVAADRAVWETLYAAYADFYGVTQTAQMRGTLWGWIQDPRHEVAARVAEHAGDLVGFAHFRPYARPLAATTGGFLDDLFVAPEARGTGVADALITAVADEGRARGWSVLRWITAADNTRARKVYDRVAAQTPWVTYDIKL